MFKEGERIVVVAKLNNDWWVSCTLSPRPRHNLELLGMSLCPQRGFIDGDQGREGLFPVNYVRGLKS